MRHRRLQPQTPSHATQPRRIRPPDRTHRPPAQLTHVTATTSERVPPGCPRTARSRPTRAKADRPSLRTLRASTGYYAPCSPTRSSPTPQRALRTTSTSETVCVPETPLRALRPGLARANGRPSLDRALRPRAVLCTVHRGLLTTFRASARGGE